MTQYKKTALLAAMLLTLGTATAQKTTLSGTLTGMDNGSIALLYKVVGNKPELVDTLRTDAKGAFRQNMTLKEPALYIIADNQANPSMCHIMMEPGDKASLDLTYLPSLNAFKIAASKGSRNIEVYRQFNDILLAAVNPAMQSLTAGQVEKLLRDNSDVLVSAFLVTYFDQQFEQYVTLYQAVRDGLVKKYPTNNFVASLDQRLKSALLPGMEAPDIAMKDKDGNTRRLSDLRGQVVLVDFWASWCGPCRRENPNVVRIYNRYHERGLEIYSVSLDKSREAWLKAIQDDGLVWPSHVSDLSGWTSSGGKTYGIASIPATVLIDREGRIIARNLRGEELERAIANALGK